MLTATASAKTFTPLNISARTSPPNLQEDQKHEHSREDQDQDREHVKSLLITPPDILGKAPVGEGSKMCGGVDGLAEGDGNASSTS